MSVGYTLAMRFQCQPGCTKCCEQRGMVYLCDEDIARLAKYLSLSIAEFDRRYVCGARGLRRLRKPRHRQCPFLRSDGCSVHVVKPTQCGTFPYWPELIENKKEWAATARWCPGMSKGRLISIKRARAKAEEIRRVFPEMYAKW